MKKLSEILNKIKKKKKIVLAFGRMNPVTAGHEKAVEALQKYAHKKNSDHLLLVSHSHDQKKNPLDPETKMKHLKRAFPNTNMQLTSKTKGIVDHLDDLHAKGYTHVTMIAGQDRVENFKSVFDRYNKTGKFKKMKVISAGNRNEHSSDPVENISGTKMRQFVKANDSESFRNNLPSRIRKNRSHSEELYKDLQK